METGFNTHRLDPADECCITELTFVEHFNKEHLSKGLPLEQLINTKEKGFKMTARDRKVALSMMQWFGTNCGRSFFEEANRKSIEKMRAVSDAKEALRQIKKRFPLVQQYLK